ncbi:MAG: hypothetical protein JSS70_20510 [Bacteroidetes bacterium]|nr:hypothetical protein [Bacteroidota bacterium]
MNQVFSFNRWLLLVAKHWSENRKKYLLGILAITGIILIWFLFNIIMDQYRSMGFGTQVGTYFVGLFIVGCLYASTLFSDLASRPKGINYLSLPASQLEKTLCALLYGVVIFFTAYTIVFYIADIIMVKIANEVSYVYWQKNHTAGDVFVPEKVVNILHLEDMSAKKINIGFFFLLGYFAVQSAYILGSVYFTRFSFIKTTVSLLVLGLFIIIFVGKVLNVFMPDGNFYGGITSYRLYEGGEMSEKIIRLPEWVGVTTLFLLKYAFAPIFWIVTYFRVKEKEI